MHIEVYTDGSATTNDKPGGYGYVTVIDGKKHGEGSGYMELASNNDAELEAAIQGLAAALQIINQCEGLQVNGGENATSVGLTFDVTLVSDSQLILGWTNGTYRFKQTEKLEKFKQLRFLVVRLNVKTRWVEGHTGDEHNERCDYLANKARLSVQDKAEKAEAILKGDTLIGTKKSGTVCLWYKNTLKVIDLDQGIVEDYNREIHGSRGSLLEIREEKSR